VLFEGEKKAETCVAESLVRVTVRKIAVGDRLVFKDRMASSTAMRATGNRAHGGLSRRGENRRLGGRRQQYKRRRWQRAGRAIPMSARVYYNERDPAACEWLRELMDKGLIPKGAIDERSIAAVQPEISVSIPSVIFLPESRMGLRPPARRGPGLESGLGRARASRLRRGEEARHGDDRHLWPGSSASSRSADLSLSW